MVINSALSRLASLDMSSKIIVAEGIEVTVPRFMRITDAIDDRDLKIRQQHRPGAFLVVWFLVFGIFSNYAHEIPRLSSADVVPCTVMYPTLCMCEDRDVLGTVPREVGVERKQLGQFPAS